MRITIGELKRYVLREFGVDDTLRHEAGFFMAGGVSAGDRDREASLVDPPPGLGGGEDDELEKKRDNDDYEEQSKGQPGTRVSDRRGGEAGSPGAKWRRR
jgi:hypothetical protein